MRKLFASLVALCLFAAGAQAQSFSSFQFNAGVNPLLAASPYAGAVGGCSNGAALLPSASLGYGAVPMLGLGAGVNPYVGGLGFNAGLGVNPYLGGVGFNAGLGYGGLGYGGVGVNAIGFRGGFGRGVGVGVGGFRGGFGGSRAVVRVRVR